MPDNLSEWMRLTEPEGELADFYFDIARNETGMERHKYETLGYDLDFNKTITELFKYKKVHKKRRINDE